MGYQTDFQKLIQRTGLTQQHHLAFTGGTEQSNYRVALGYINHETVIKGRGDRTFMSNMNMTQMMFDGFLRVDLGMFSSTGKQRRIFDEQLKPILVNLLTRYYRGGEDRMKAGVWEFAITLPLQNFSRDAQENDAYFFLIVLLYGLGVLGCMGTVLFREEL